jgi:molybdate transport system permease protein
MGVASLAVLFALVPLAALLIEAPWSRLLSDVGDSGEAVRLSLVVPLLATLIAVVVGVPVAWVLAVRSGFAPALLRALVLIPVALPPVVAGVALLAAYGRRGLVGRYLPATLPFTTAGAVLAVAYVVLPFVVITSEAGFRSADPRYVEVARTLGSRPAKVWWRVSIPLALPALISSVVLAWGRALGEFGATITFAGNSPGRTQTLPLAVFVQLEQDPAAAFSLSVVILGITVAVLLMARRAWSR